MTIVEVGPRDGLQNEARSIPTEVKVAFVDALSACGLVDIEVSAFVSPKWVPQLQDAEQVFAAIKRHPNVVYSALVPNMRGLERALAAKVDKVAVFTAASETFTQKNINTSIEGSFQRFSPVCHTAHDEGLRLRGYVSTAFWCPYEGQIAPDKVLDVVARLFDLGVEEVSIGDTIGKATPGEVGRMLDVLLARFPAEQFAMHFHDTYGHAVENLRCSVERGIQRFDASAGGIGGCPYAPGASGNIATEKAVQALEQLGVPTGVDVAGLQRASELVRQHLSSNQP